VPAALALADGVSNTRVGPVDPFDTNQFGTRADARMLPPHTRWLAAGAIQARNSGTLKDFFS
jgi:hypothetical protein